MARGVGRGGDGDAHEQGYVAEPGNRDEQGGEEDGGGDGEGADDADAAGDERCGDSPAHEACGDGLLEVAEDFFGERDLAMDHALELLAPEAGVEGVAEPEERGGQSQAQLEADGP